MHGEEESLSGQRLSKDHSWRIVKTNYIKHPLHHHMLFGDGFKENSPHSSKNKPAYSVVRHDWNFKWDWFIWSHETKNLFLVANPPDEFSTNRDKKYHMPTVKYTAGSLMLWACFSAGGPGHLFQTHGIMDSMKY